MSASLSGSSLPPSSSLPPIRHLGSASEEQITSALTYLHALYCPLRLPSATISKATSKRTHSPAVETPIPVDSGYASQDEDEDEDDAAQEEVVTAVALRADPFERAFATKWLTGLIERGEEMAFDEHARERIVEDAASILSAFFESVDEEEKEDEALTREFAFPTPSGQSVHVTLNDAPLSGTDHTDVGLQSWGASIVLSSMMCADADRFFGLFRDKFTEIVELGAGTGLVSLTVAKLLAQRFRNPRISITATDSHAAVLRNCKTNIDSNFPSNPSSSSLTPHTAILDWTHPPAHLKASAHLLLASDVVYAPEHAAWLRDCAAHLLAPRGTFWLMATIRKTGKFEGIEHTVDAAFACELCPRDGEGYVFSILEREFVGKRRGVGRGDEGGYYLYRIGWA
ncbi:hypothetical protein BDW02DRAFT_634832 [Decorospora gaudefroyi]|uniref:S-adenosyl-L-methionine-dependent methyltransferase n=1 Tax=Decorospora gaudefroyi TaxID=184978 RepID=A0A6A5JWF9_9PLEO|nr:hypothetical protein BDW02DRAFT_634832 [Decorospora gaudefroyi]